MFVMLFVGSCAYDDEQSTLLQASIKNHEADAETIGVNKSQSSWEPLSSAHERGVQVIDDVKDNEVDLNCPDVFPSCNLNKWRRYSYELCGTTDGKPDVGYLWQNRPFKCYFECAVGKPYWGGGLQDWGTTSKGACVSKGKAGQKGTAYVFKKSNSHCYRTRGRVESKYSGGVDDYWTADGNADFITCKKMMDSVPIVPTPAPPRGGQLRGGWHTCYANDWCADGYECLGSKNNDGRVLQGVCRSEGSFDGFPPTEPAP